MLQIIMRIQPKFTKSQLAAEDMPVSRKVIVVTSNQKRMYKWTKKGNRKRTNRKGRAGQPPLRMRGHVRAQERCEDIH